MDKTKKTAAIYCRISLKDEAVPKVEQQEEQCLKLAEAFGYDVVKVYTDDGISAFKDVERPAYEELLSDVRVGKYEVILAVEESRFTRQGIAEKERFQIACTMGGASWHTTREGFLDPSTDSGEFISGIRALIDKQELQKKTRRQRDRYAEEQAKGNPLWGGRPFGYELDRKTIREEEAAAIREGVRMILEDGATVYGVMKYLNNEVRLLSPMGNRWGTTTTKQLLTRPRNAGVYVVGGVVQDVKATWQSIISRDTYDALIAHLKANGRTQPGRKPSHVGTGVILCGACGEVMRTGSSAGNVIYRCKTKTEHGKASYSDGTRHVSMRAEVVEQVIREEIVNAFFSGSDVLAQSRTEGKDLSEIHARVNKLNKKRDELKISAMDPDSPFTMTDVAPGVRKIDQELDALQANLSALIAEKAHAAMLDEIRRSMSFLDASTHRVNEEATVTLRKALAEKYDSLSLNTRKILVQDLLDVKILTTGRGRKKIAVQHKIVTHLNEAD